jgi:biopolymer transport protein ExbD
MGMNIGSSASDEPEVMLDINTTPLIDVMLVLLIMLIITIPMQLHSVNLDMPVSTPPIKKVDPVVVSINIDSAGVVFWDGKAVENRASLEDLLKQADLMQPQPELHIKSDAKAKYEVIAGVLAAAQRHGLNKLGILGTEQFAN